MRKHGLLQVGFLLGLCIGVMSQEHDPSSASALHGQVTTSAYGSNGECRILVDGPIIMDKDLLLPVPKMRRNCVLRGVNNGSLVFPNPVPFFSAGEGVVVSLEELRVVYWEPLSLVAMFMGMMDVNDGAMLNVRNVILEVTERCLGWLREEIEAMGFSDQEVDLGGYPGNVIVFRSVVRGSLSLTNVKCVGVGIPLLKSEWLAPMRYYVETTEQLVHSLSMAERKGDHSAVEVVVVGLIVVTRDDLPEGRPFRIWRKVVLDGLGNRGTLILSHDLANGQFVQIKDSGNMVLKNLEVDFSDASRSLNLPIGFNANESVCQIHMLNSKWRTSCASIKSIFEEQIIAAAKSDHSLAILDLGEGDPRTIEVMAGNTIGMCLYQSKVTCNFSVASGARDIPHFESEVGQARPGDTADAAPTQVATSNSMYAKKDKGFHGYSHIILGGLVVLNALLLSFFFYVMYSRCKRKIRLNEPQNKTTGKSDLHGLHTLPSRFLSTPRGNGAESNRRTDSSRSSHTQLEFLHEIHEEGRGIEDKIMELKEQVGSGMLSYYIKVSEDRIARQNSSRLCCRFLNI